MTKEIFKSLFYIAVLTFISFPVLSNKVNAQESTAVEEAIMDAEAAVEAATEENVPEVPASAAPTGVNVTHSNHHPQVFIVPLGGEMNLKVRYNHPMDFAGGNYIESIKMEKFDGSFLGLKQFNERSTEAFAEFLVNPKLADFTEVVLIGKSSKMGEIRSIQKLELTPTDQLPDEFNPAKVRERAMKALQERNAQKSGKKPVIKAQKKVAEKKLETKEIVQESKSATSTEEEPKKKKWGLF